MSPESSDPAVFQEFREALGTRDPKTIATLWSGWLHSQVGHRSIWDW